MLKKSSKAKQSQTSAMQQPPDGDSAKFLQSLQDVDIIERVRCTIKNAHVFKLPPRQSTTVGWRGADWTEKVWQGTVKVVERGDLTAVLLVDRTKGSIFAVCPAKEGAIDRCVDSSRYFVLRIENANGRHMFIGVAFNERNDAFDFNTALEDSKREREIEKNPVKFKGLSKDYSIKEGQKIRVSIPKVSTGTGRKPSGTKGKELNRFLKPSHKDTPSRTDADMATSQLPQAEPKPTFPTADLDTFFNNPQPDDPFPGSSFKGSNFFRSAIGDESTGSGHPFFKSAGEKEDDLFDPKNY